MKKKLWITPRLTLEELRKLRVIGELIYSHWEEYLLDLWHERVPNSFPPSADLDRIWRALNRPPCAETEHDLVWADMAYEICNGSQDKLDDILLNTSKWERPPTATVDKVFKYPRFMRDGLVPDQPPIKRIAAEGSPAGTRADPRRLPERS